MRGSWRGLGFGAVWEAAEQAQGQWRTFKRRPANARAKTLTTFGHAPREGSRSSDTAFVIELQT